ncbi:MAG: lysophospholipid acyltransferase family protein [Nocardioidaceae bacterium]
MQNKERVYPVVIGAARVVFRALGLRLTVEGDEFVPSTGPVVLVSNHVSFLDFLLVGLAARESRRDVRFLARHDVWTNPVARPLMTAMRHVPVDREAPAAAYLRARTLLREGEAVGIFPEAGVSTSYTVRALMPGAVALARETGAPLVPMAIWGPQRILTAKQPVDLHRGRPVSLLVGPPSYVGPGDDVRDGTARLGARLQGLLDDLQARPLHGARPGDHPAWLPAHLGGSAPTPEVARVLESLPSSAQAPSWAPRGLPRAG